MFRLICSWKCQFSYEWGATYQYIHTSSKFNSKAGLGLNESKHIWNTSHRIRVSYIGRNPYGLLSPTLCSSQVSLKLNHMSKSVVQIFLEPWQVVAKTSSLGTLFWSPITLSVKNIFLIFIYSFPMNFPWCSFIPLPCVLSLVTRERRSAPPFLLPHPVRKPSLHQAEQARWPQ